MPVRPQEIVERALAGPVGAGRAVVVTQTSEAVLRWANSTMTTNGHIRSEEHTSEIGRASCRERVFITV